MLSSAFLSTSVCFHYVRQKESVEQWSSPAQPRQFLFLFDGGDDIALPPEEEDPVAAAAREQNKVALGIEVGVDFLAEFESVAEDLLVFFEAQIL